MITDGDYEGVRRIVYGEGATFVPVCSKCGRFVKRDDTILMTDDGIADGPNATCSKCGRTEMIFEGFIYEVS